MILISVVVGYLLGIAPFIYIKLTEREKKIENKEPVTTISNEIFNEWLYGEQKVQHQKNQEDLYEEYMTGKEVSKGE